KVVKMWDLSRVKTVLPELWSALRGAAGLFAFAPDSGSLWTTRHYKPTGGFTRWDVRTGQVVTTLKIENDGDDFAAYRLSPDGRWLLGGGVNDSILRMYDTATGKSRFAPAGHRGQVSNVTFSPDGRLLASVSADRTARLWDLATGREVRTLEGHRQRISSAA